MVQTTEVAVEAVEGVFIGMGINYVWEVLRLPGYGIEVIPLGPVTLAADDLAEMAIGGAVAVYGYTKRRSDPLKGMKMIATGLGIIGGVAVTKAFEAYGGGAISPISPPTGYSPQRNYPPTIQRGESPSYTLVA